MAYLPPNVNSNETNLGFLTSNGDRFIPDKSLGLDNTPQLVTAKFGDGYEQRARLGINSLRTTFSVTFSNRSTEDAYKLCEFFDEVLGVNAFKFAVPSGKPFNPTTTYLVVCDTYNKTLTYNNYFDITATFRRVYN